MAGLALVLWALLVSAELAGSSKTQPSVNLSCYRCFKATQEDLCTPSECSPTDQVCVSTALHTFWKSRVTMLVSKRCALRCPNTNMEYEWSQGAQVLSRITRQCCSRSLCNGDPGTRPRPRSPRPGLLLPLGLSLLGALL